VRPPPLPDGLASAGDVPDTGAAFKNHVVYGDIRLFAAWWRDAMHETQQQTLALLGADG